MAPKRNWPFLFLLCFGIALRVWFVAAAHPQELTFHSGGSDAPAYNLLADNLIAHKGFGYAGQPTAFRPPGYPLILAGFKEIFHGHYVTAVRWFQFVVGLLAVWVCGAIALDIADSESQRATIVFAILLPTMIYPTAQLLTEGISSFLTALFLLFLTRQQEQGGTRSAAGLGLVAGLESLIRFNAAMLLFFGIWAVLQTFRKGSVVLRCAAVVLPFVLLLAPWLIRNELVFHGHVLFSTQTGTNAAQGVISAQGRTQPGDTQQLKQRIGWAFQDLETNGPSRNSLPSEVDLNRDALRVIPQLWREQGWHAMPLLVRKTGDFWLSTDQLLDTKSFAFKDRMIRTGGVLLYLLTLGFAVCGMRRLWRLRPGIASLFLVYAVGLTILHFPFVMNTRLRIPLLEPFIVVLAGVGWEGIVSLVRNRQKADQQVETFA
jgi:4-amino-4-deoxy-L-arabinose transferase-like glycosyltransferase